MKRMSLVLFVLFFVGYSLYVIYFYSPIKIDSINSETAFSNSEIQQKFVSFLTLLQQDEKISFEYYSIVNQTDSQKEFEKLKIEINCKDHDPILLAYRLKEVADMYRLKMIQATQTKDNIKMKVIKKNRNLIDLVIN